MRVAQKPRDTDNSFGFRYSHAALIGGHMVHPVAHRRTRSMVTITLAVLVGWWGQLAQAQETTNLVGRVRDVRTGLPLPDVRVTILDTESETRTNFWGEYRLPCGSAAEVNVRLVLVGYASVVERVVLTHHQTIADFTLTPVDAVLDKLIVQERKPGVAEDQGGHSVREVGLEEVLGPGGGDVLKGVPGVLVLRPSGQVGSGTKIQLRGLRSLFSSNEPLVYVDGVRVSDARSTLARARGESVLDLIPPSHIDRIEVFKGPAATARYGVGALPGVIHIHTKKGPVRKPH